MPKVLLFMKKKKGLSDEEFRHYYETYHAPLAEKHHGKYMLDYRRNYLRRDDNSAADRLSEASGEAPVEGDFDVITEIWYRDRESMEAMWAAARTPEVAGEMDPDGEKFLDTPSMKVFVVDECERRRP